MKSFLILAVAGLLASPSLADLKPDLIDCDAEKAARNAAMKATVGVHGGCDPEKLADDKKGKARDKLDDARDGAEGRKDEREEKLRKGRD